MDRYFLALTRHYSISSPSVSSSQLVDLVHYIPDLKIALNVSSNEIKWGLIRHKLCGLPTAACYLPCIIASLSSLSSFCALTLSRLVVFSEHFMKMCVESSSRFVCFSRSLHEFSVLTSVANVFPSQVFRNSATFCSLNELSPPLDTLKVKPESLTHSLPLLVVSLSLSRESSYESVMKRRFPASLVRFAKGFVFLPQLHYPPINPAHIMTTFSLFSLLECLSQIVSSPYLYGKHSHVSIFPVGPFLSLSLAQ